jgi:glycosyltransferase involved in cell wall biosynthesis
MMRIVFIHRNIETAGAEPAEARQMIKTLLRQGHTVGVLYVSPEKTEIAEIAGAQLLHLGPSDRHNKRHLLETIERFRPQIGHIKSLWTPFHAFAASALQKLKIPYIVEPGGHLHHYVLRHRFAGKKTNIYHNLRKAFYQKFVDLPLCRKAAGIRALSEFEAKDFQKRFGLASKVIPLGFNPEWVTGQRLKAAFPEKDKPLRVNYLGRLDIPQKGLDLVIKSMAILRKRGLDHFFTVRISGPDVCGSTEKLRQMINEHDLQNIKIESGCFGEEKNEFFRNTDIFLHLSRMEEMAKLAREATGAGVPVLASLESNYGDWIQKEGSGLAASLEEEAIIEKLSMCVEKRSLIKELSSNAWIHANKYSWDFVIGQLVDFYKSIVRS